MKEIINNIFSNKLHDDSGVDYKLNQVTKLREVLAGRWPEAVKPVDRTPGWRVVTGLSQLDSLFPRNGLREYSIAIFGPRSSGKISLALLLAKTALLPARRLVYMDGNGTFYPPAASLTGIDLRALVVARPPNFPLGLRVAEVLVNVPDVGGVIINRDREQSSCPDRLINRLQLTARNRRIPLFFVLESKVVSAADKALFPFVLSVRRALVLPELNQRKPGEVSRKSFV